MKKQWIIAVFLGIAIAGSLAFVGARTAQEMQEAPEQETMPADVGPSGQPIAFPHNRHAGEYGVDCQYCHFSAERSSRAGIPPVATCYGCHRWVEGPEDGVEIDKVLEYWNSGEPIPWNRIYSLPDHVQFPHLRHVAAEVECQECHGPVEEIEVIQEVAQPLTMGWCLDCHIEQGATRDCTACHY